MTEKKEQKIPSHSIYVQIVNTHTHTQEANSNGIFCMSALHRCAIEGFTRIAWFIAHICCGWILFMFPAHHKNLPHRLCVRAWSELGLFRYALCQMTWEQIMSTEAIKIPLSVLLLCVCVSVDLFASLLYVSSVDIQFVVHTVDASAYDGCALIFTT